MGDINPPASAPISPQTNQSLRGGSPGGRRGRNVRHHQQHNRTHDAALRGGRDENSGRGGRNRGQSNQNRSARSRNSADIIGPQSPQLPSQNLGSRSQDIMLAGGMDNITSNIQDETTMSEITEGDVCFICASTIEHTSIAPCNHQTCHICSLRLRALYKTRACAHCRTEADFVIFTDDSSKRYEDFKNSDFVKSDENLGIKYEKDIILEDTILLLRYNCPDTDCDVACFGWPDLHRHVRSKHGKVMCDLCTRNKKVFTHEHDLFTFSQLRKHEKFGDDNPGAIDQSGFKGHPECGFCRTRFYGDDELYTHCREKHERCHICDRRNGGRDPQYYLNYEMLEKHFQEVHFVCLDAECQANKTNVFESEMDLKAHQLTEHPNGLSKDARRDARLVNISGFDYRTPYQPPRRGGREGGRGAGRGRDPNAEPLPTSSAQPIGRAELAYQRQLAIQNSQPPPARLTGAQPARALPTTSSRPTFSQPFQQLPAIESLSFDSSTPSSPQNSQDQARQLRHGAVMERASNLLENDQSKMSIFRTQVSSYRSSTISATELIDAFFALFDAPSSEIGKLIRELADIYEIESKRTGLLEAWNSWRAINEDYPSLPGPVGTLPGLSAITTNTTGRRVLRLKSSTAQSSRSAFSRQGSWGNVLASSASSPFPALGGGAATLPNGQKKPAWSNPSMTSTASRISPANSRPSSRPSSRAPPPRTTSSTGGAGARASEEMFPSLPAAAKPSTLMAGLTRGSVRWEDRRVPAPPGVNPWSAGAGASPTPAQAANAKSARPGDAPLAPDLSAGALAEGDDAGVGAKKKGKKNKGQVLYHFG